MSKVELVQAVMAYKRCSVGVAVQAIEQATRAVWICKPVTIYEDANATITFVTGDTHRVMVDFVNAKEGE